MRIPNTTRINSPTAYPRYLRAILPSKISSLIFLKIRNIFRQYRGYGRCPSSRYKRDYRPGTDGRFRSQAALHHIIPERLLSPRAVIREYPYLRGWHFMRKGWDRDDFLAARKHFAEAVELDPKFAQAHALLSLTETSLGNFRHVAPADVFPTAFASASKALALDETSPQETQILASCLPDSTPNWAMRLRRENS
jgi:hypothetical protein